MQKTFVVTGQRVEKDSLKRIALKLISCYLQKIRTAVGLSLIRQCANLLIVGAVAFSTYAKSYNRLFGYHLFGWQKIWRRQEVRLQKTQDINAG